MKLRALALLAFASAALAAAAQTVSTYPTQPNPGDVVVDSVSGRAVVSHVIAAATRGAAVTSYLSVVEPSGQLHVIAMAGQPASVTLSERHRKAIVPRWPSDAVVVVDLDTLAHWELAVPPLANVQARVAVVVDEDAAKAYLLRENATPTTSVFALFDGAVTEIDLRTLATRSSSLPYGASSATLDRTTHQLFITGRSEYKGAFGLDSVAYRWDPATQAIGEVVPLRGDVLGVGRDASGTLYAALANGDQVFNAANVPFSTIERFDPLLKARTAVAALPAVGEVNAGGVRVIQGLRFNGSLAWKDTSVLATSRNELASWIDLASGGVTALPVRALPSAADASEPQRLAAVAYERELDVFTREGLLVATVQIPAAAARPTHKVAIHPTAPRIFVTNAVDGSITIVDLQRQAAREERAPTTALPEVDPEEMVDPRRRWKR